MWIKLWNVPLELFSLEGIGCIASAVGRPLYLDKATEERRRVSFARVCVEARSEGNLPQFIKVDIEGMGEITINVDIDGESKLIKHAQYVRPQVILQRTIRRDSQAGHQLGNLLRLGRKFNLLLKLRKL